MSSIENLLCLLTTRYKMLFIRFFETPPPRTKPPPFIPSCRRSPIADRIVIIQVSAPNDPPMTPEDAGACLRCLTLGSGSLCLAWHLAPDSMPGATARAADLCRFDKCRPHSAICDASRGSGCALRRITDMTTTCVITRAGRHKNRQGICA